MTFGPLATYVPPNVYTRVLTDANVPNLVAGIRIPTLIGVGQEELEQDNLELVRGSSSTLDQQIVNEDVSHSWIVDNSNPANPVLGATDGTKVTFVVKNRPIVDGQGFGRVTNDVRSVAVTVNGLPVALASVQGAKSQVTLQIPPQPTDVVRCTYFFHRGDTLFTDDVSNQVTNTVASLTSPGYEPFDIVAGTSDTFGILVNGTLKTVVLSANSATTALSIKSQVDAALISGLSTAVFVDEQGRNHVTFSASSSVQVGTGNANGPLGFTAGATAANNASFRVFQRPIVDGTGGGITTTDTSKVVVKVNGVQTIPVAVDGKNGLVTVATPPPAGSLVTITYSANTWQDTFDYLPNTLVTNVIRAGISPNRSDYIQGADFVVANPSSDTSLVFWGASFSTQSVINSPGAEPFDNTQITGTLVDDQWYLAACTRFVDTTVIPSVTSTTKFVLPAVATTGNGRNTPLGQTLFNSVTNGRQDLATNRPDLIVARVGRTLQDAMNRAPVTVVAVDSSTRQITLQQPVPPDFNCWATFWYNRLVDDTYVFTNLTPGSVGTGQYKVFSSVKNQYLYQVRFKQTGGGLTETVNFPRGVQSIPDAFHVGGTPVSETVRVTFGTGLAGNAVYTIKGPESYSFFTGASDIWTSVINGTTLTTTLGDQVAGYLVSQRIPYVSSTNISVPVGSSDLELTIDGVDVSVTLTTGTPSIATVVADINTAIDAATEFSGTAPNNLCSSVSIGSLGAVLVIKSYTAPATLPGGFDAVSNVTVRQGTAETVLGLQTFQTASGTSGAVCKPATLLGTQTGPFNVTAGLNDQFVVTVNGVQYTVTLPAGASVAASAVVTAINTAAGFSLASNGTLGHVGRIRLMSNTNNEQSSIIINQGSGNAVLGFTLNESASQTRVTAQEVVNELMATSGFVAKGVAYTTTVAGEGTFVTIASKTTGASASTIAFANAANSAFNVNSGTLVTPGVDGDNGEDASDNFTVSSTSPNGSGGTGIPGQTYTDAITGLRFTVLPATDGSYASGGWFEMDVSQTFNVSPSVVYYFIPGLETMVSNTVNVGVNDTASMTTVVPSGTQPKIGDFYFISYRYMKQDFSTRIFQQFKTITANYGPLSPENRVTLGAYLAILNGAVLVGITQVLKVPNTNQANAQSFIDAIDGLATPLPGNVKPDILVPLATDTSVYSFLTQHCEVMSNERNAAERMGFIGFASGTSPTTAQTVAKGLLSQRIVALYPDSAVITLSDELGQTYQTQVDGTFFAAAVAGAVVSPSVDVATPYTRRTIQGFTSIPRILDAVDANQTATAGITILEDLSTVIRIRQGLTTNMTSILTRLPTVTQIADFVSEQSRSVLDAFIGTKFLTSRTNEVEVALTSMFNSLVSQEIVGAFTGISAKRSAADPTTLEAQVYYQPIFPLLYILLTFNLRASL